MFLPLKDDNPTIRKPYVTVGLISLNVLVYLFNNLLSGELQNHLFTFTYGLIPYEVTHLEEISAQVASSALRVGALDTYALSAPILLTPFTSMFMHGGLMHLGGNMLYLWIYGNNIEDYFGPVRFLFFYLIGGIAAVALHVAFSPNSPIPLVGASGAISAVLGAYLVLYPRARVFVVYIFFYFIQTTWLPAWIVLGLYFVIQVFNAFLGFMDTGGGGGVAFMAHLGGFAFGWLLLKLIVKRRGQVSFGGGDRRRVYKIKY